MRRLGSRLIPFEIAPCLASQDRASRADWLADIDLRIPASDEINRALDQRSSAIRSRRSPNPKAKWGKFYQSVDGRVENSQASRRIKGWLFPSGAGAFSTLSASLSAGSAKVAISDPCRLYCARCSVIECRCDEARTFSSCRCGTRVDYGTDVPWRSLEESGTCC